MQTSGFGAVLHVPEMQSPLAKHNFPVAHFFGGLRAVQIIPPQSTSVSELFLTESLHWHCAVVSVEPAGFVKHFEPVESIAQG